MSEFTDVGVGLLFVDYIYTNKLLNRNVFNQVV